MVSILTARNSMSVVVEVQCSPALVPMLKDAEIDLAQINWLKTDWCARKTQEDILEAVSEW